MMMNVTTPEKAYWVALNKVNGIGSMRFAALLKDCGSAEAIWRASIAQLQQAGLDRRSLENLLQARRTLDPAAEWAEVVRSGVTLLTWADAAYPSQLKAVDGAPPVLYLRGELSEADLVAVALVGTRRATSYGREVTHNLATDLARHGITVVSGLALGVDTVAHQATLDAGGRTLAVLGSGVDRIYPPQNRLLAERIVRNGAIISDYPLGTQPMSSNFPPRNRIISGLSQAVVIVEASQQSGALITAKFAVEQGRDLYAVPGSILHPGSVGCNELIRDGAIPLLSINDLLQQLNPTHIAQQQQARLTVPSDPMESKLLSFLSKEPCHIDDLARQSALPVAQISGLLAMMELKGMVRQAGVMSYVKV